MTPDQIQMEVQAGGKFVIYQYCISILVMSFKRNSAIHFIRRDGTGNCSWQYSLISLFLGWWGIPWGLIWTPMTMYTNTRGGIDVTQAVLDTMNPQVQAGPAPYNPGGIAP